MVSEEYRVILLRESSDRDAALMTRCLTTVDGNIHVRRKKNCAAILEYLQRSVAAPHGDDYPRPHLIILCIAGLTDDVIEVLTFLQQDANLVKAPVLIFSETPNSDDISAAYGMGVNSYLRKPDDPDVFAEAFREVAEYWLKWNQLPS